MADKAISELVAAEQITTTDMFVLEQNNTAKKLTGQILLNWLTKAADGHGGISSIEKLSTGGLTDTYRITLADTTTYDFPVENGKGIIGIVKQSTSGLVDTYKISYNDGASTTFTVTNGAKGDKGDNAYLWIKYASQQPTASGHSMSDIPDNWIGVYSGNSSTAPTDYTQYQWFQYKGEKGDTGAPATLNSSKVEYQASDSGTIIPSGTWSTSVPVVAQGKYMWTRATTAYNTGDPVVSYSVSRMGIDGTGSVSSVANVSPGSDGNVPLTAEDVGALPSAGGDMTGEIRMNGQPISGLNLPEEETQAASKGYVDTANVASATKLKSARTIQANLASTKAASFDGTEDVAPGVTGTLPISNGGTGATTASGAIANLGGVKKSGDTMTGTLIAPQFKVQNGSNYPYMHFEDASGGAVGSYGFSHASGAYRAQVVYKAEDTAYTEEYRFPTANSGRTGNGYYDILTTKTVTYGTTLPAAGTKGRIFFKKVSS